MSEAPIVVEVIPDLRSCGPDPEKSVATRVRDYIAQVRAYLTERHRAGDQGMQIIHANSDLTDRLVRRLFSLAEESLLADGGETEKGLCVAAVGGFARREMCIHSDVDLLVVHSGELTPYVAAIAERLQYWMWDAGLTVGCATRTPGDTVRLGWEDNTVRTAVLAGRFLCGDGEFFHEFTDRIRDELLPDMGAFIDAQFETLRERHERFGESAFLLQPNIKEGVGGLRDYHTAFWVARATQPTTRDFEDFLHFGLLTDFEMRGYREALDFLWRARNELHLRVGRCADQMSFELQEQIAEGLGYVTQDGEAHELAVESFMGDYYRHVRAIQNYSELVMEQCRARAKGTPRKIEAVEVEDGFRLAADHLEIPHRQNLRERPVRLLTAFVTAQRHQVPLSRMARRMIRMNLDLVDDAFRRDPECSAAFLEILSSEHRVMRTLVTMNEEGLLAAYIPEWDHIVCRWQHVIYHTYTVDIHSIFLVEELRRLWRGKYQLALPELTELMEGVKDREVLFLGCLFHDIGKGLGGDHSNIGVEKTRAILDRLGLEPERAERVLFLVRHHLLMSHIAQRRDLSDAHLILDFAQLCRDRKNLRNLYLLTFADIRASSRDAWTDWKGQLLMELFERTAEFLESGADDRGKALELIEGRVEIRRDGARATLRQLGVAEPKIDDYFDAMPRRYFISHNPRQIARHAEVVLRLGDGRIMSTAFREMRGGFTEFILCARDVPGLYSKVAGVLAACRLNILGSHVYTSREAFALEVYRIRTPRGGREEREFAWREFEDSLESVLGGKADVEEMVRRRQVQRHASKGIASMGTKVIVSNEESEFYTIADITSDDRIGLLFDLTHTIAEHGFSIFISKVATVMDQVADTFYLKDTSGKKVNDVERIQKLQADLLAAAERGGGQ